MVTVEELERREDNESFERIEKEAEEKGEGDEKSAKSLLAEKICEGVAKRLTEDAMKTFLECDTCSCSCVCDRQQVLDIPRSTQEIAKPLMPRKKQRKNCPGMPQPVMPEELRRCIEELKGNEILFVIEKELTKTDLENDKNRLSIPSNQIKNEFLKAEEYTMVGKEGVEVLLIQPSLMQSRHQLKKWNMRNNFCYNIINGWYGCKLGKWTLHWFVYPFVVF